MQLLRVLLIFLAMSVFTLTQSGSAAMEGKNFSAQASMDHAVVAMYLPTAVDKACDSLGCAASNVCHGGQFIAEQPTDAAELITPSKRIAQDLTPRRLLSRAVGTPMRPPRSVLQA
ncbi:MAG: hypothetical protein Q8O82_00615 [Pseudorhodobacter sp.]|nr:hypothetical protein [Pseudorhodobacter sp.]